MKKIITSISSLALGLVLSNTINAQVLRVEYIDNSNDTFHTTGTPSDLKLYTQILADADTSVNVLKYNYKWQITSINYPSDWTFIGICDNITCYSGSGLETQPYPTQTSAMIDVSTSPAADKKLYVNFIVEPQASIGTALVKINVLADSIETSSGWAAAPAQTEEVTFIIKKSISANSIETIQVNKNSLKLYPNPVNGDYLNIEVDAKLEATSYQVTDVQGRIVKAGKIVDNKVLVSDLTSGVYNLGVLSDDGVILTTKQFVK